jgi:hypothetical protein
MPTEGGKSEKWTRNEFILHSVSSRLAFGGSTRFESSSIQISVLETLHVNHSKLQLHACRPLLLGVQPHVSIRRCHTRSGEANSSVASAPNCNAIGSSMVHCEARFLRCEVHCGWKASYRAGQNDQSGRDSHFDVFSAL